MNAKTSAAGNYTYHDYSTPDPPHQPLYLSFLLRQLRNAGAKTVLDVGCGDGNFSASLASEGFETYGIDLSQGGITKAKANYPNVSFSVASAYDDYSAIFSGIQKFDAVVSVEVIEHLYSPRDFVRSARSAAKPRGLVIVTTPYWGYLKNIVLAVTNRTDRSLNPLWDGGHIKHWSRATLCKLFEEQNFENVSFYGAGRPVPFLWNGMAMSFRNG
ncbi:MAG TPA: class I SAM-dependent methyltransferase [Verrucomicrobiae bacterium]|jgi:2-polyprenyl-6-hydroxyphenyl methylase/3-demethylubiquinone-9 3-methyltransferase